MRSGKPAQASERGAAAVEFALVLPVLIMMIFGMVDMGMVVNAQAIVGNAAREGARSASFNGTNTASAVATATGVAGSLMGSSLTVTVTCKSATATSFSSCPVSPAKPSVGDTVMVTVSYDYQWLTPAILGLPGHSNVVASSQMRIESV